MDMIDKIIKVLTKPFDFFESLKKEKGIKDAFVYLVILSLIATVLAVVVGYFFQGFSLSLVSKLLGIDMPQEQFSFGYLFIWAIISYSIGLAASFLVAGLLHVWILIFGGKADYNKTYQLYIYTRTPGFVFGWIPVLSSLIWIYNLVLLIIGTEKVHEISRLRAVLMYVIPIAVLILFYILIFVIVIAVLGTSFFKQGLTQGMLS
ncbi:YIP1 family protein [Candidatus Woesearchaeota archaeon]|nr:YIP1 family protein [Candidatus Woesearchaeota archaeon]